MINTYKLDKYNYKTETRGGLHIIKAYTKDGKYVDWALWNGNDFEDAKKNLYEIVEGIDKPISVII